MKITTIFLTSCSKVLTKQANTVGFIQKIEGLFIKVMFFIKKSKDCEPKSPDKKSSQYLVKLFKNLKNS